ncbi:MAG TPA: FAD-binding protein, partial [Flavisolibacter sp.]|nr:FAD-binding protein [Flavisolibacter sp.]
MNKRHFLKTVSALAGGAVLSRLTSCAPKANGEHLKNWAGNLEYSTGNVHYPTSLSDVQEVVKNATKLRALGSRHSFNTIADSTALQVSSKNLNKIVSLDKVAHTVTVESGVKYGELAPYLHQNGYALPNLASLPHISIAGACSTATHGSGVKNGNLSTAVSAIEFVDASGNVVHLSKKDGDPFYGAVVGLGALGVLTKLTLDLVPTYQMKQVVYRNLPMEELKTRFADLQSKGYSVSLFTNWRNKTINEVWIKSRVEEGVVTPEEGDLYGAKPATQNL